MSKYKVTVKIEEEGKELATTITAEGDHIEAGDAIGYNQINDFGKVHSEYAHNGARTFHLKLWSDIDPSVRGTPVDMG